MKNLVKNKKMVLMGIGITLVVAAGAGIWWYVSQRQGQGDFPAQDTSASATDSGIGQNTGGYMSRDQSEAMKYRAMIESRSKTRPGAQNSMAFPARNVTGPGSGPVYGPERLAEHTPDSSRAKETASWSGSQSSLDRDYGPLFSALNLPPEDLETLKKILLEKNKMQRTKSQQDPTDAEAAKARASQDERIHDLLGDDLFAVYQDYQKKRAERQRVSFLKKTFDTAGHPLDSSQEKALAEIFYEERQAQGSVSKSETGEEPASTSFNKRVLQRAQEILSPEQMRAFANSMKEESPAKTPDSQAQEQAEQ